MPNKYSSKFHGHNVAAFSLSRRSLILSALFLCIIAVFLFFRPFQGNRCLNSNPRSVKVVWEHSTAAAVTGSLVQVSNHRHKAMGFVGIQTGFGSVGRRQSLRNTWFPSDHQSLQRYLFFLINLTSTFMLKFSFIPVSLLGEMLWYLSHEALLDQSFGWLSLRVGPLKGYP